MIRYTTLESIMKSFSPESLIAITGLSTHIEIALHDNPGKAKIKDGLRTSLLRYFNKAEQECNKIGLSLSVMTIHRIVNVLSQNDVTYDMVNLYANGLTERIMDEMKLKTFFSIEPTSLSLITEKNLFGQDVMVSFPSAIVDIEEAGKCLAFERWTASVFHLMRVMEVGLRVLGNTLNIPPDINPSWERILKKCDDESKKPFNQKSPEWQNDSQFFESATAMLHSVKNSWRNPTMHIERIYTEEQAEDIWNAVKGFMRQLSKKLKESTN